MHINKGLKKFGKHASKAGSKEMQQLHDREAIKPVWFHTLMDEEREEIIDSLLLIEEKCNKDLKVRTVARGVQQKNFLKKEEVYSPMLNTTSIFIISRIEANENRVVRVHDVPNVFVQTDIDKKVVMKVKGKKAELLLKTDPKMYRKFAIEKKGYQCCMWNSRRRYTVSLRVHFCSTGRWSRI